MKRIITAVLFAYASAVCGQSKVDSLLRVLSTATTDEQKADLYYRLGASEEDNFKKADYFEKSAHYAKLAGDVVTEAGAYNKLGIQYYGLGDYEKTLEYFYKVINIHEETGSKELQSKAYNNVGLVLSDLDRHDETIEYFMRSLELKRELGDSVGVANTLSNLGQIYDQTGEYLKAHKYYKNALEIDQANNREFDIYKDLSNLGDNFRLQGMYDSADRYYERAVAMMHLVPDPYYKAELLESLAKLNVLRGEYTRAIEKYNMALMIAENIEAKALQKQNLLGLSKAYKKIHDYEKSLTHYEKYMAIEKEIFNEDQANKLAQVEENFQLKSKENEIRLLNSEAEIKDLRLTNTMELVYGMGILIVLVGIMVFMQYRKNIFKSRSNELLKKQNEEIATKNKDIMDSILCAKNIQEAILPEDDKLEKLCQDSFVFAKARDIVSGDFYWFADHNDHLLIAAVDCTGHGVPAAFLNVLGNSMLNQIVYENNLTQPASILEELNRRIHRTIKAEKLYAQVDDGMDIGLCMINRQTKKLRFAGAKRPLYIFNNGVFKEIKGDYASVGGTFYREEHKYSEHSVDMVEGDTLYLFTDGIVDQFGGDNNKKFMYPRLRKTLKEIFAKPLAEQKSIIQEKLTEWQGVNEQTDDMLMIGIRV